MKQHSIPPSARFSGLDDSFVEVGTVHTDARGRLTLAKPKKGQVVSLQLDTTFKQYVGPNGEIRLVPMIEVPEVERWLYENPEALSALRQGILEAGRGEVEDLDEDDLAPEEE